MHTARFSQTHFLLLLCALFVCFARHRCSPRLSESAARRLQVPSPPYPTCLRAPYAMPGTEVAYAATTEPQPYGMCGTEKAYGGTRT
eukprot:1214212-Rhodomonas_salina.1